MAIRQNPDLWHSSMLLIVYDEHGGLFDHVPPVPMPSPDSLSSLQPAFDFTLSGLRVPAVVISPYIRPQTICSDVFDHTSVIATAMTLFTNAWPSDVFFERAKQALTLDRLLDLNMAPRDEWPDFPEPDYGGVIPHLDAAAAGSLQLSDLQAESVRHAISLNESLPGQFQVPMPDGVTAEAYVAGAFVKAVGNAAVAAHQVLK
jgi:phospholipase C